MASLGSLLMGQDSGTISPATVARRRLLAQRLATTSNVKDAGLLGALSNGLGGALSGYEDTQAANEETAGRDKATASIAALLKNPNASLSDLAPLIGDPWMDQSQSGVVNSLLDKQLNPPAPPGPIKIGAGDTLLDPSTYQPLYSSPSSETDNTPAAIKEYEYAVKQGFKGTYAEYETQMRRAGATNLTFNGEQANAATFADRMRAAEPILQATEGVQGDLGQAALGQIPLGLGNFLQKPEFQQAVQAQRDFINAVLRKESGAAISPSEFENAQKQYFPQPGDGPQVIEQKRQNRAIAIAGMERSGGPAYSNPNASGNGAGDVVDYTTYFGGQ